MMFIRDLSIRISLVIWWEIGVGLRLVHSSTCVGKRSLYEICIHFAHDPSHADFFIVNAIVL